MNLSNKPIPQEIITNAPADAKYWDTVDSTYAKNLTVNETDEFEWQYLSATGQWNYCNSEVCPVVNGEFIELSTPQKPAPISTQDYLKQYYTAHQASQAKLISEQEYLKSVVAQQESKSIRQCILLISLLVALVFISAIFTGFIA